MVLVLFFMFLVILIIMLLVSDLKINIKDFKFEGELNHKKYELSYDISFGLYLFGKLPYTIIRLDDKKLKKLGRMQKNKPNRNVKNLIKKLVPEINKLNLDINIGIEDAMVNSFVVFLISTVISILLPKFVKYKNRKNIKYRVTPLYNEKNMISICFDSIICIKMVHIISIIYTVLMKRRVDKNGRTSNRRTYAYSHE